ncbi:MAG: Uncharacterised protein [Synechococcus sp. CC9902]|nr:MAG: Uncharacterised protein [Synechococcus sp. CC9902]
MFAHKVLIERFLSLSGQFHRLINQCHLVDEQIPEHPGTVHHHINAGTTQFLERNELQFVDPTNGIRHRLDPDKPQDLGKRFPVGFDVVGTPEHAGDRFRPGSLLLPLAFNQFVDHTLGRRHRSSGWDGLRIKGVNVFAAWKDARVANRVSTWTGKHIFAIEGIEKAFHFHVRAHLLKAEAEVAEQLVELP